MTQHVAISQPSRWSASERYLLIILLLVNTFSYIDRQVINILADSIKQDLDLMDWQIGAITGLAFALLYALTGIPIARIAERVHRPSLLGISMGVWSVFTMLCGAAQTFWQMALCRIGVGLGEAGATPISHSLIIDRVPRENRALAIGIFSAGTPLGVLLGMVLGGLIADHYGWRAAFAIVGAPGLILALVLAASLAEPRGGSFKTDFAKLSLPNTDKLRLLETIREIFAGKSFALIALGSATGGLVGFVHSTFFAAFMMRAHLDELKSLAAGLGSMLGMPMMGPIGFLGLTLGLASGIMGILGTLFGGWLADRVARRGAGAYMTIPAAAKLLAVPLAVGSLLAGDVILALTFVGCLQFVRAISHGPALSSVYALIRPEVRPMAAAVLVLIIAVIGLGAGPLAAGLLSDILAGAGLGERDGLRVALICAESVGVVGTILFLIARPIYAREAKS